MVASVAGRLQATEAGQKNLLAAFEEHEQRDEKRFADLATRFEAGQQTIRADLALLSRTITEAISGDNAVPGLRERVRALEGTKSNLKWAIGILGTAVTPLIVRAIVELLERK